MPDRIGELASMEGYSPEEADFQFGIRSTPWFGEFAQQHGEPNLNDPNYDYRAAWAAGARPNVRDPGDNQYHWPSQFKGPEHPNRFVNGVDTITGQPVSTGEEYAGLGGDPSHLATTIKNWWTNQPSWLSRAQAENQKTTEAFQRGGMGEIAKQLASDTTEAQDLAGGFGVGNIKGVRPLVAPGALAATSEYRPPFYSAVERAVQGAKQNAAPGQQWAGFLRNQPGVKPEEVEALKLGKLFEQPGSVPKEAVLGEIAANRVNVGEVIKSEQSQKAPATRVNAIDQQLNDIQNEFDQLYGVGGMDERRVALVFSARELRRERQGLVANWQDQASGRTKFSQYTLPGGENYREMLLTLPSADAPKSTRMTALEQKLRNSGDYDTSEVRDMRAEYMRLARETRESGTFKSPHFDEPNVLAHVRYNDRVIDGKKTLFVEEVQSDWHQKGKKQGYSVTQAEKDKLGELNSIEHPTSAERIERDALQERARSSLYGTAVPDAPFKTTWPELAMKRIIREAAEKGYDKVAWTPGSVQAARYDLSKHVDSITVVPAGDVGSGTKRWNMATPSGSFTGAIVTDKSGKITNAASEWGDVRGKHISDVIGKDVAAKGLAAEKETKLSGVDLKVGGEGMKGFYDEILPATVNKLVKKHGGRVQQSEISAGGRLLNETEQMPGRPADVKLSERGGGYTITLDGSDTTWGLFGDERAARARMSALQEAWDKARTPVHTIDITPSLRAQAMKGFPLFTAGGVAATGIMGEMARQDEYQ